MNKNFFTEFSRVLAEHGIQTASPERNMLTILLNGLSACRVHMCIFPGDLRSTAFAANGDVAGAIDGTELYLDDTWNLV